MTTPSQGGGLFRIFAPVIFVLIWSTGWIVARYSADYADALTFLLVRYLAAGVVLLPFALLAGAGWPRGRMAWVHAIFSGVLIHAFYLGAVWWAVRHGVPASISALLAALQPILTAILAPALVGERIGRLQWAGIVLGFIGIVTVLSPQLSHVDASGMASLFWPLAINVGGMVSITLGTFYQKRFIHSGDLRSITFLQYVGAFAATLPIAWFAEDMRIVWNLTMAATLAWSVLALSIVAVALLLLLIRRGEVARSAQLIYLVPPTAALQAWLLFGEHLSPVQIAGLGVTALGVALASRRTSAPAR